MAKHHFLGNTKLLSFTNPKAQKSLDYGYITAVLHLAPAESAGFGNVCPYASEGCKAACLNTSGAALWLKGKLAARAKRTAFYFKHRKEFYERLKKEIAAFERKAANMGVKAAIRLNCTSDIKWPRDIFTSFPDIQFYDYTKGWGTRARAVNHHITYSRSEDTIDQETLIMINAGFNVAVVFKGPTKQAIKNGATALPTSYLGVPVVSGLLHDLRFMDKPRKNGKGVIVGLKPLGKAKQDDSGFVVNTVFNRYWLTVSECSDVIKQEQKAA